MQILFLDESGTPPPNDNGVPYFVLGGVIIPDAVWRSLRNALDQTKAKYGIVGEIKWRYFAPNNDDQDNTLLHLDIPARNSFREDVYSLLTARRSIKALAVVSSVRACYAQPSINNDDDLYHFTYKPITERFQYYLQDLERESGQDMSGMIVCDHRGPRDDKRLQAMHQRLLNQNSDKYSSYPNLIEGLFIAPSHWSVGIQLADMVAGAVYRKFVANDSRFYDQIESAFRKSPGGKVEGYGLVKHPKAGWV